MRSSDSAVHSVVRTVYYNDITMYPNHRERQAAVDCTVHVQRPNVAVRQATRFSTSREEFVVHVADVDVDALVVKSPLRYRFKRDESYGAEQ